MEAEARLRERQGGPGPRSARDWVVDTVCFLLGVTITLSVTFDVVLDLAFGFGVDLAGKWRVWLDLAVGLGLSTALWWRRRWPVGLAAVTLSASLLSDTAGVIALIAVFTVAVHRRSAVAVVVAAASLPPALIAAALRPAPDVEYWQAVAASVGFLLLVVLWGMVVRSRRQLVVSLRDRAERADAEQQLRVAQARAMERTRIAREMHDVLAHRISLLSLHAGALEIHPDASPAQVATAAGVIRASAHQALQDLREVIGVLREPVGDDTPERPQPTLGELPGLVEESRAAGVQVDLDVGTDTLAELPTATGRAAYRIVQEGLTNARKHAPGTAVRVRVAGAPGTGLDVELRNSVPPGHRPAAAIPGTGTGLVGLTERATLAGGRLRAGPDADGGFTLSAWLPWAPGKAAS